MIFLLPKEYIELNIICIRFIKYSFNFSSLLKDSFGEITPFTRALKVFVSSIDSEYAKGHTEFFIGFEGSFGSKHTTPRTLTSSFLGNMVCVEGIAVKCKLYTHRTCDYLWSLLVYLVYL